MRLSILTLALAAVSAGAASSSWLREVEPIVTSSERSAFQALTTDEARDEYIEAFWKTKAISADEYYQRLAHIDGAFGSGKLGSGANTDRGRLYLTLGAPDRVSRIPSSRIFYPLEIWHYSTAEAIGINYQLQFIFFERNGVGDYRLYSPQLDTIRKLLNPQAATRGMFPVNDSVTESDIRNRLNVGPAEDEVIEAAIGVARGIKGVGNDEILARATAPSDAIRGSLRAKVTSRLIPPRERAQLKTFQSVSMAGTPVVDLMFETRCANVIGLQVSLASGQALEQTETKLGLPSPQAIRYQHRLFLLPGEYKVELVSDGAISRFPLKVEPPDASEILVADAAEPGRKTPFSFGLMSVDPNPTGSLAVIQLQRPEPVQWRLSRGASIVWKESTGMDAVLAGGFVVERIGAKDLPKGEYVLTAKFGVQTRSTSIMVGEPDTQGVLVSYNANLREDSEWSALSRQWLARGNLSEARRAAERAWKVAPSDRNAIDLARIAALEGDLDSPRPVLRAILDRDPKQFDALSLMAFIETKLQDYPAAADYYRKALTLRESPELSKALAEAEAKPQR